MYHDKTPGGKSYLYNRTLKKGCPHLIKLVNREKNMKTALGAIRADTINANSPVVKI